MARSDLITIPVAVVIAFFLGLLVSPASALGLGAFIGVLLVLIGRAVTGKLHRR